MGKLVLEGKTEARTRREPEGSFDQKKRKEFLALLTESCNVKYSAEKAGVAVSTVYRRKAADATLRAAWNQAIGTGYSQL